MSPLEAVERDGAAWVTLRRPPHNILDLATIHALHEALTPLRQRSDLKAVVLRSALEGTFSAGVDVADHAPARAAEMLQAFHALVRLLDTLPQATIAAVDGRCLGGGCEMALLCDLVLATPRATFGQPEIDVGCFPPVASAWLSRLAPRAAFEMVLGGVPLAASEALQAGLISRVVTDLDAEVQRWVKLLCGKSGVVLALARRALRQGAEGSFDQALTRLEQLYLRELLATEDAGEGVSAFLEKRRPQWRDR